MAQEREQWASRWGLILAMAGNAVGLGNFLRFPVQAANNGGGAFMIPYFIAFILLAIPLMWVEWTIGRHGGRHNHGSLPGMFDTMWNHPIAKYIGAFGLFISASVMIYYAVIVSWTLAFSFYSITGEFNGMQDLTMMKDFLTNFQGLNANSIGDYIPSYTFLIITLLFTFYVLSKGLSGGIEKFALIAMPLLLFFAIAIAIVVLFIGTPDPTKPDYSVWNGIAYIWNPNYELLSKPSVWLAAAGQVFFTLSVGMGTLQAYASYLKPKEDIALNGIATASINEFAEVILGGLIAIPIAVAFFGLAETQVIAKGGSFNLGFVSMGVIFQKLPMGNLLGFAWFFLLFFAGATSAVAMVQPVISFLEENFHYSHKKATLIVGIAILISVHFVFFNLKMGFLDEMDYWSGTFGLVLIALIEIIIFGWIFGIDKGWEELNEGADIKIPVIFKYVIKYVTPLYLLFVMGFWTVQEAIPTLFMETQDPSKHTTLWGARIFMIIVYGLICFMVYKGWQRRKIDKIK